MGPGSSFLQGAGERATRAAPVFSKAPALLSPHSLPPVPMQGSRWQAPLGRNASSPSFHPTLDWAAGVEGLVELFGTPPTPTLRYTVHAGTASAEKLEGWARLVRCWLSLMIAVPGGGPPRADVSEAAESWPGLLQPPTPTVFFFFLKERKKVGDARGAGDRTWGRNKGGQLGRGAPGLSLAALGWG